jgi:hypothetical protein
MVQTQYIQDLINAINSAYDQYIAALDQFNEHEINVVPFANSWTPGQVTHHIIRATKAVPDSNTEQTERPIDAKVAEIEAIFLDFSLKYESPDFILPDMTIAFDKQNLLDRLQSIRLRHLENISKNDLSETCIDFELPSVGFLTRYEWYRFIAAHCLRHTYQLNTIFSAKQI